MLLFKVGIGAVFDSASGPLWSFRGASEMRVKSLRIRIDIVTVLRVFKVHFLGYSDFVLIIRIYSHAFRAKCYHFGSLWSVRQPGTKRRARPHRNNSRLFGLPAIPAPFMGAAGYLGCGCFGVGWA